MRISECSKETNLSIDTIRYYEKCGLIKPNKKGYYKDYTLDDVETLRAVKVLRFAGLKISDLQKIIKMNKNKEDLNILVNILDNYLENIEKKEKNLQKAKKIIKNALDKVKGELK